MQGVFRKLYMSILAATLILLTSIATTFAWVGMLTSSSLGSFDINLKVEDLENEYYLQISGTDSTNSDDYLDSIPLIDVQKQIMTNMDIDYSRINSNDSIAVNNFFRRAAIMTPVTTDVNLDSFLEMKDIRTKDTTLIPSKKFFKFDIYLTVATNLPVSASTEINANVFFKNIEDAIVGITNNGNLINGNPFENVNLPIEYSILKNLPATDLRVNSANAVRLGFKIYKPILIEENYDDNSPVDHVVIYQKGNKTPVYKASEDYYDLGGILPEQYNLAIKEIETQYKFNLDISPEAMARIDSDLAMTNDNYHLWHSPSTVSGTNYLGFMNNHQTKLKITTYFWFEGWDADCLNIIDRQLANLRISLATDTKNNS